MRLRDSDRTPAAVQAAVDACAQVGGEVEFTAGRWPIGELRLRSRTGLRIAKGCVLEGGVCIEDAGNVAITGEGADESRIEGGVRLVNVRGIKCRGFHCSLLAGGHVEDGEFIGLTVHQPPQRQAEGSAVFFCWGKNIRMSDCDLESNDDVFCLKRGAENITLTRSRLCGRLAAPFKIGTETDGLFSTIEFTDSVIEMSDRAAISIESVDGAEIRDVRIERIRMNDVNAPLFIRLGNRDVFGRGCGKIHHITFADVEGYGDVRDEGYGSCVTGLPGHCVEDVVIRDVRFISRGGQSAGPVERQVPELPELYPEFDIFGRLPAHGLYARHVRGLRLERAAWTTREVDGRPAIALEDVERVQLIDTDAPHVRATVPEMEAPMPAGNTAALLAAIRSAKAGKTVVVEPGEYAVPREELPIVIGVEGVTIRSESGPDVTRIRAVGAMEKEWTTGSPPANLPDRGDSLFVIAADRVTVSSLALSGAFHNIRIDNVRECCIENNRFEFSKRHQVYCHGGGGHRLIGNTSRATNNNAFKLDECHDCIISGNLFENDPAAIRLTGSCRNTIESNRFMSVSWHGIMIEDGANGNTVNGNLFAGGRLTGIQVRGSDETEIRENEFCGNKAESVLVDSGSRGVRLRRNRFHDNRGTAVSNETSNPVDAVENWWGSADGPGPGAEVDAGVLVDPWLKAPQNT